MATSNDYNAKQLEAGKLTADHITALVRHWQETHGLTADGMAGPATLASILGTFVVPVRPGELVVLNHDLIGTGVAHMDAHRSWFGGEMTKGRPLAIVAHYTATDPGTAVNMAKNRQRALTPADRAASWHLTIDADGSVVQMIALNRVAWHAGSDTAKPIPGVGWANNNSVGIELVGHGKDFPSAQVASACKVWRAIVRTYGIPREHAMITHQSIDPTRRTDPGPVWGLQHADIVLDFAYAP